MAEFPLPRVINAAGQMSALGGSVSPADVARRITDTLNRAMTQPVEIARLKDEASARIAAATGAEAGAVTTGAAAAIALSVAACVGGTNPEAVAALPHWIPKRVVLQSGHDINFGADMVQMLALGGGVPFIAGSKAGVSEDDISYALTEATALVYVQSHHVRAKGCQGLETCIRLAHAKGVPVIVDAAAEEDLRHYIALGADLVCYSGGKALGGLSSSGFVAGRADLIEAVRAQDRGIGRAMKVAQEQILSIILSLDFSTTRRVEDDSGVLAMLANACAAIPGIDSSIIEDEVRPAIRRVEVRHARAERIVQALREGEPPIFVRAHGAAEGRFALDIRNLAIEDVPLVAEALAKAVGTIDAAGDT